VASDRKSVSESVCYFCGGTNPATTTDHVPPRACFPDGYAPEGFEVPACDNCNKSTRKQDQIFGFYSQWMDFDESKIQQRADRKKLLKLWQGIKNNYPDALPDRAKARRVDRVGAVVSPRALAVSLPTPDSLKEAVEAIGAKLTHALYLHETGLVLTAKHRFTTAAYQPQQGGTELVTSLFSSLLPLQKVGGRVNIRNYGTRFGYKFGYKEAEGLFVYAAQFGHGLILWGITCGPGIEVPEAGPLSVMAWNAGGSGGTRSFGSVV
jgi:hypothetical protein